MTKRHIANAMYIAKSMGRKGYANEGAVTEEEQLPIELSAAPPSRSITPSSLARRWTPPEDTIAENIGPKASEFMQSYPAKLAQGVMNAPSAAYEGMKYPGQLLYGEKAYDPEEAVQWSGGLATNMLGASSPFALAKLPTAAEAASTTRIFAGLGADTADVAAYRAAKTAKEAGVSPDKIWKEHGWGWTKDDKPISPSIDQRLGIGTDAGEAVVQPLSGQGMPSRQSQQSPQAVNQLFGSPGMTQWREKSVIPASKVEDRYYTGTSKDKDFPDFNVGRHGAWFTKNPADASMYAQQNDSKGYKRQGWDHVPVNTADRVIPVYLRAENPYTGPLPDIAYAQNYKKAQSDWFDQLRAQGHDAWMPKNAPDLAVILKNPSDIKSAISNSGDFDRGAKRIDRDDGGRAGYFDGGMPEVIDLETEAPDAGGYPDVIDLETPMPEGTDTGSSPMSYAPDDEPAEQPSALAAIAKIAPQAKKPVPVEQPYATAPAPMSRADETWGRMLQQESNRQHFDESGRPKISSAGAVGIAQVKPATGKEAAALAGEPWNFKRFHNDPEYNERLGRAYYDQQLQRFGDPTLAAAAYNAGPSRLNRALGLAQSTGRDVSNFLPAETRKYIRGASGFANGGCALPLPKNATGGAIADRAIMLLSKKAKRQPGRG